MRWHGACISPGMRRDIPQALAGFLLIALGLISCVWRPQAQLQAPSTRIAAYELQVEEGFGRLDQLPTTSAKLPH